MGSSCSILNDTEHDVWINHGVNWTVLGATLGTILAVVTAGAGLAAFCASVGVGGALLGGGAWIITEAGVIMGVAPATVAGLTATTWSLVNVVTGLSATVLSTALSISREEAEKIQKQVRDFQAKSKLIKPGEKYTWSGTLSLMMKVYVMNDKLQIDDRACYTGSTDGSENVYPISEYFQNLDVKKKPGDTITVYRK